MGVIVRLEGDGLQYQGETTPFNAAQIIGFLSNAQGTGGEALLVPQVGGSAVPAGATTSRPAPREALQRSGAKTNGQKITVLGHYVATNVGHEDSFMLDEVKNAFRRAGEPLPANFSRDVQDAVRSGLIYEDENVTGTYRLTDLAVEFVDSGFPEASPSKLKKATRVRTSPRDQINEELNKKLRENGRELKDYIAARSTAFEVKATNKAAIIAVWLLDVLHVDGINASDLYTVYRFLGIASGSVAGQLINARTRDGYFGHIRDGKSILSSKGEDFGRHHSLNAGDN
jgi:hypothetical protein